MLSIITVTKNNLIGLKNTIKSTNFLKKTNLHYEIIIIDGQSKDGTVKYLKKNKNKFLSEEDKNIFDAFNKGIKLAKFKYVWMLNAGDTVHPDCENAINFFLKNNKKRCIFLFGYKKDFRIRFPRSFGLYKHYALPTNHQAMIIPRDNELYNTNYIYAGCYDFYLRISSKYESIKSNDIISIYEGGGQSDNDWLKYNLEVFDISRKQTNFIIALFLFLLRFIIQKTKIAFNHHI